MSTNLNTAASSASPATAERRRLCRYPANMLHVELALRKGLFRQWQAAQARDFTRTGLSVSWQGPALQVGDRVDVRVCLTLERGELVADRLAALVRNVQRIQGEHRYGLEFDYGGSRHLRTLQVQATLGRIEGILDRTERLHNRLVASDALNRLLEAGHPYPPRTTSDDQA